MDDPSAWVAEDYRGKEDTFIYRFTEQDLREVEAAVAIVEARGLRIEVCCITPAGLCMPQSSASALLCCIWSVLVPSPTTSV